MSSSSTGSYAYQRQRGTLEVLIMQEVRLSSRTTKLVISITAKEPFSNWVIDVVGPMPTTKNNAHAKKYIIATVYYVTQWKIAHAVVQSTGNDIQQFVGKEILSKFGALKQLITDGDPKLVTNATKAT